MRIHARKYRAATVRRYLAFTLVELMIAIVVMLVVIAAAAQIFGTVTKVAGLGEATADVLQEASAIERQLRNDIERLSKDGFFAIRCVEVPNDVNGGQLLNPLLPDTAMIRADQLVFFTYGRESTQRWIGSNNLDSGGNQQAIESRVYFGHGFQLPSQELIQDGIDDVNEIVDGDASTFIIVPWWFGVMDHQVFNLNDQNTSQRTEDATQPSALKWLLTRQQVLLADDGGGFVDYLNTGLNNATSSIWDLALRDSRVDIAATQFNDIRSEVIFGGALWGDQQATMASAVFYPRAERYATTAREIDQMITKPVLSSGCSSFIVDWTYEGGTGYAVDPNGAVYFGFDPNQLVEQPWFGLNSDLDGDGFTDHVAYTYDDNNGYWTTAATINPDAIERHTGPGGGALSPFGDTIVANGADIRVYEAYFGYNASEPLNPSTDPPEPWYLQDPDHWRNYTPWPSAIRVTMVLHDPASRLEQGREVQFVINLPKRAD